jgi:hypothetical protein
VVVTYNPAPYAWSFTEMSRILKEGISTKKLTSKGHKRATTYVAR